MATWATMHSPSTSDPPAMPSAKDHDVAVMFAAWMAGSHAAGVTVVDAAAPPGPGRAPRLAAILQIFAERKRRAPGRRAELDDILRSDPTAVVDLDHPLVRGDVRRLYVLQRELQRACLTATLGALPAMPRAAFVLLEILRLSFEEVVEVMGSAEAVRTAHCRALRELEGYLGPRCEHMDPKNLCHCSTRLGVAIERGFVGWPAQSDLAVDSPVVPLRRTNAPELFAALPPPA